MKRILSLAFTILVALCIEVGIFMLIAHWLGIKVAIAVIAVECVLVYGRFTKSGMSVMKQRNDTSACQKYKGNIKNGR